MPISKKWDGTFWSPQIMRCPRAKRYLLIDLITAPYVRKLIERRQSQQLIYRKKFAAVDSFVSSFRRSFKADFSEERKKNKRKLWGGNTFYLILIYFTSYSPLSLDVFRVNLLISIDFSILRCYWPAIGRRDYIYNRLNSLKLNSRGKLATWIFPKQESMAEKSKIINTNSDGNVVYWFGVATMSDSFHENLRLAEYVFHILANLPRAKGD